LPKNYFNRSNSAKTAILFSGAAAHRLTSQRCLVMLRRGINSREKAQETQKPKPSCREKIVVILLPFCVFCVFSRPLPSA
jgi:hypothetical protein